MSSPPTNRLRHRDYCAAVRCYNSRARQRNLAFFTFPKEPDRCKKWVENCRGEELPGKTAEALFRFYVLCADHFEDSQFEDPKTKTLLIRNAIPTLLDDPDPPLTIDQEKARGCPIVTASVEKMDVDKEVDKKCQQRKVCSTASGNKISTRSSGSETPVKPAGSETPIKPISRATIQPTRSPPVVKVSTAPGCVITVVKRTVSTNQSATKVTNSPASAPIVVKKPTNSNLTSPSVPTVVRSVMNSNPHGIMPGVITEQQLRYMETRKTLTKQRNRIVKLEKQVKILKAKVKTRRTVDDIIENASKYMSGVPLDFFASQLRMASKKDNGRRWTEEDKFFALMLKCVSLEAYRLCSKVFSLPCTRTLQRWLKDYKQEVPNFESRLKAYKQKLMMNAGEVTAAEKALKSVSAGNLDVLATGVVSTDNEGVQDFGATDQMLISEIEHQVICMDEVNTQSISTETLKTSSPSPFVEFSDIDTRTAKSVLSAIAAPKKAAAKKPRAPRQKRGTTDRAPRKKRAKQSQGLSTDQQSLELLASLSTIVEQQPGQQLHMQMQSEQLTLDPVTYELLDAGDLEAGTTFAVHEVDSEGTVILTPINSVGMTVMCNQ